MQNKRYVYPTLFSPHLTRSYRGNCANALRKYPAAFIFQICKNITYFRSSYENGECQNVRIIPRQSRTSLCKRYYVFLILLDGGAAWESWGRSNYLSAIRSVMQKLMALIFQRYRVGNKSVTFTREYASVIYPGLEVIAYGHPIRNL